MDILFSLGKKGCICNEWTKSDIWSNDILRTLSVISCFILQGELNMVLCHPLACWKWDFFFFLQHCEIFFLPTLLNTSIWRRQWQRIWNSDSISCLPCPFLYHGKPLSLAESLVDALVGSVGSACLVASGTAWGMCSLSVCCKTFVSFFVFNLTRTHAK